MKKLLFLLFAIVLVAQGCKNKESAGYTILGDYTPYTGCIERLTGKVQKVTEKYYQAIPDGEAFKKGSQLTRKYLDSLKLTQAYTATFNEAGYLLSCTTMDENSKPIDKWDFIKENNVFTQAKYTYNDTLRVYQNLKYNDKGYIIEAASFRNGKDTLINTITVKISPDKDTITYNDKGQFLSYGWYNKDGSYHTASKSTYNEKGKMSQMITYDNNGKVTSDVILTYEYDAKGNWVRAIAKWQDNSVIIEEREYSYF
jgi:hypothetical protein